MAKRMQGDFEIDRNPIKGETWKCFQLKNKIFHDISFYSFLAGVSILDKNR